LRFGAFRGSTAASVSGRKAIPSREGRSASRHSRQLHIDFRTMESGIGD
jgi:hypothetical protein